MKKLLTILCLVLLSFYSIEVSFSQSNQEDCDLLCQMGLSESTETQTKKTQTKETQTETPKKEVPSYKLVERRGIIYEVNSQTPFTGSSVGYYENGELQSRENRKNGESNGLFEHFYDNGQLEIRGNLKNGLHDGLWEYFDENGDLTKTEEYKDGEQDGLWKSFDRDGKLTKTEEWKDGVLQD